MPRLYSSALAALLLAPGCGQKAPPPAPPLPSPIPRIAGEPRIAFSLRLVDVVTGTGAPVRARQCIYAHYTGWLAADGKKFDSSRDTMANGQPRTPLAFAQGLRRVIPGWDAGFEGMNVGGQRRLLIPYQLAYGELGRPPVIPPKAELIFDVEVMAVGDTLEGTVPNSPARCRTWAEMLARPR